MDSINKEVLTTMVLASVGLCAVATLSNAFAHKEVSKEKQENEQKAKVIHVEDNPTKECLTIFLDTDHHPNTAEASVKVVYGKDFPAENIQQVLSNDLERTVWEWKKWGVFSKLSEQQK